MTKHKMRVFIDVTRRRVAGFKPTLAEMLQYYGCCSVVIVGDEELHIHRCSNLIYSQKMSEMQKDVKNQHVENHGFLAVTRRKAVGFTFNF